MEDNAAGQHSSALDVDDDYSEYEVSSKTEILTLLRGMQEQGSLITFYFDKGHDFLLTSLIDVPADGKTLVFDCGTNKEMSKRALDTDQLICVSSKDKVKIQFVLHGVAPFKYEGRDALRGDVPDSLVRLQRREYYRASLPMANPIKCRIPIPQRDGALKSVIATLVDISGSGVGLTVPPDDAGFKIGAEFSNVRFDLPNVGAVAVSMRVLNIYEVSLANGNIQQRAGCQFIKLPGPMLAMIQRFIIQVERERKSREV